MQYAQGSVSVQFKKLLKEKIESAKSEQQLDQLLNGIHDVTLACRNSPDGLREAVKMLESK